VLPISTHLLDCVWMALISRLHELHLCLSLWLQSPSLSMRFSTSVIYIVMISQFVSSKQTWFLCIWKEWNELFTLYCK
jgi:hypothetical protein